MKKHIRFFHNKEDGIPCSVYLLLPENKQTDDSFCDDPNTIYKLINNWMGLYPNAKVDLVWLNS